MNIDTIFNNDIDEKYIQVQYDGIVVGEEEAIIDLHKKLRQFFEEVTICSINQIHIRLNN